MQTLLEIHGNHEAAVVSFKTTARGWSLGGPHEPKSCQQRPSAENTGTNYNSTSRGRLFCPFSLLPWNYRNETVFVTRNVQMTLHYQSVTRKVTGPALHLFKERRNTGCIEWALRGYIVFERIIFLSDCILSLTCSMYWFYHSIVQKHAHI